LARSAHQGTLNQLLFSPAVNSAFLLSTELFDGKEWSAATARLRQDFVPVMKVNL
jgi:hypothetical protein